MGVSNLLSILHHTTIEARGGGGGREITCQVRNIYRNAHCQAATPQPCLASLGHWRSTYVRVTQREILDRYIYSYSYNIENYIDTTSAGLDISLP